MVSLDPDDFLADLADELGRPSFPCPEKQGEEEELEWLSNMESFPSVETCMLPEEPPRMGKAIANAEQRNGALSLLEMPGSKTKDGNAKAQSMRVCTFCGVVQTVQGIPGICNACGYRYKSGRACGEEKSPKVQTVESDNAKAKSMRVCAFCGVVQTLQGAPGICNICGFRYKSGGPCTEQVSPKVQNINSDNVKKRIKRDKVKSVGNDKVNIIDRNHRMCTHCGMKQSTQWRAGPLGRKTLCNACGLRYRSGRLCPEYRPANSPTFSWELHSNKHRVIMEKRNQVSGIKGTVANPVDKRTNNEATMTLEKMRNIFPSVSTGNIVEQPSRSVIAEQQSPISVLENNINSSTTLVSHQPPNKVLRQQHLFSNQLNNKHNQEDTTKVEAEIKNTIVMSSHGTVKLSYKVPSKVLDHQQLFSSQPTNKRRKKNTVEVKSERINATLMSSCENLELPHQAPSEFLEHHQLFDEQHNNCKHTATVEMTMKAVDKCIPFMNSKKDSFSAVETLNILDNSRGNFIAEQQSPVLVLKNSTNSSATLMSSSESVELRQLVYNPANDKRNKNETSKVEIEGKNSTSVSSYRTPTLPHQVPSKFMGPQMFSCQPTNKRRKKNTVEVKNERINSTLMSSCENLEPPHQAPSEFLEHHQLFNDQPINKCINKHTAKVEMVMKAVDNCEFDSSTPLMKSTKDSLAGETLNILDNSRGNFIAEQQSPVLVLKNSTNSSAALMSSSESVEQQQQLVYNPANYKLNENEASKVEIQGMNTTSMSSYGTLALPNQVPGKFLGPQQLFFDQPNNNCNKKDTDIVRIVVKCQNCGVELWPQQWEGSLEPQTLCFSCMVAKCTPRRKRSTSLAPRKKRKKEHIAKVEMAVKPGVICTNSMNSKKDPFIDTSNISEQTDFIAIAEQQTPASVPESSTNSRPTLLSSSRTVNLLNQAPSEFLRQQNQFCDSTNYKPKEKDVHTMEVKGNSSTLMRSSGTLELPNLAPIEVLEQQQLFCHQANNTANKKDTVRVESKGNGTTLMSPCDTSKPLHQAQSDFLGQEQMFSNQANNETNKENTAKVESEGKCHHCGDEQSPQWLGVPIEPKTLCHACGLAKCTAQQPKSIAVEVGEMPCTLPTGKITNSRSTLSVLDEFYLMQRPSDIANAEHQNIFSGLETSKNNSMDLMSSCRMKFPHRARSKGLCRRRSAIPGQQAQIGESCMQCGKQTNRWRMGPLGPTTLCNVCGNKYQPLWGISSMIANLAEVCQHCGSEEGTHWLICSVGPKTVCAACYHWIKYFCNQTNNNPDREASTEVDNGRKCHHCGVKKTPLWRPGPMGSKTLCNACGVRWYKFGDLCRDYP